MAIGLVMQGSLPYGLSPVIAYSNPPIAPRSHEIVVHLQARRWFRLQKTRVHHGLASTSTCGGAMVRSLKLALTNVIHGSPQM